VLSVETIDRGGHAPHPRAGEYRVSYRQVIAPAPEEWFIAASLSFERRPAAHESEVRALLERRKASQPIGEWSCGFGVHQSAGRSRRAPHRGRRAQGFRIGDASVSHKHANFIINHGRRAPRTWSA